MAYSHSDEEEEETNLVAWLFKEARPENVTGHTTRLYYHLPVIGSAKLENRNYDLGFETTSGYSIVSG